MTASFTGKLTSLRLVYPPISNQEAVWVEDDEDVVELLRTSDFYMIGARAEAKFSDFDADPETQTLRLKVNIGNTWADEVELALWELLPIADGKPRESRLEAR